MHYFILTASLFLLLVHPFGTFGKSAELVSPTNKSEAQEQVQNFVVYVKEPEQQTSEQQEQSTQNEEHAEDVIYIEEVPVKIPVLIPVKVPYPIKVPLPVPVPVKYPYIIHKKVEVPIEKKVPYPVEKPYPVKVIKKVPYDVPEPYPVKVPVHKTRHVYYELEYPEHYAERRSHIPPLGFSHPESGIY